MKPKFPGHSKLAPRNHRREENKYRGHIVLQHVPSDTKIAFKAACYRKGKTMRDVFIEFMRHYAAGTYHIGKPNATQPH